MSTWMTEGDSHCSWVASVTVITLIIAITSSVLDKIVGPILVNPLVDFKKPFEVMPKIIASRRNIYPDRLVINLICFTKKINY